MHDAALYQDMTWIQALLSKCGIKDEPAEDGLTGFTIALGLRNVKMATAFLRADVQPREQILFLAEEALKVEVPPEGDLPLEKLKISISEAFNDMAIPFCKSDSIEKQKRNKVERKKSKFPLINPDIEEQDRYYKNKKWLKNMISIDNEDNLELKLKRLQSLVLGKFCIRSKSDHMWILREVETLECSHTNDRFVSDITNIKCC